MDMCWILWQVFTEIYSNAYTFTAVKPDGSIRTWGDAGYGGAYASSYNLALGKPATESSTYPYSGVGTEVCFIRDTNLVVA
jgi:hypothetical protein